MAMLSKADAFVFADALDDAAEHISRVFAFGIAWVDLLEEVLSKGSDRENFAFKHVHALLQFLIHRFLPSVPRTSDGRTGALVESICQRPRTRAVGPA